MVEKAEQKSFVFPQINTDWRLLREEISKRVEFKRNGQKALVISANGSSLSRSEFEKMLDQAENGPGDNNIEFLNIVKKNADLTYAEVLQRYQRQKLAQVLSFVTGHLIEVVAPSITSFREDKAGGRSKSLFQRIDEAATETARQLSQPFGRRRN